MKDNKVSLIIMRIYLAILALNLKVKMGVLKLVLMAKEVRKSEEDVYTEEEPIMFTFLKIYTRDKALDEDVDLKQLSMDIEDMNGAEVSKLFKEAGSIAESSGRTKITKDDIDRAILRFRSGDIKVPWWLT